MKKLTDHGRILGHAISSADLRPGKLTRIPQNYMSHLIILDNLIRRFILKKNSKSLDREI